MSNIPGPPNETVRAGLISLINAADHRLCEMLAIDADPAEQTADDKRRLENAQQAVKWLRKVIVAD